MLFIIIFLTVGVGLGLSIRKIAELAKTSEKVLTVLYYPCLLLLGIILHMDEKVVSSVDKIGWPSVFNILTGFVVIIILFWSVFRISRLVMQTKRTKSVKGCS